MIRVFDIPARKEEVHHEAVGFALGLLHEAVESDMPDDGIADLARFYIECRTRWEGSREWRAAVKPCRD